MSGDSPPTKKLKKVGSELNTSNTSNFLGDVAAERKKVSKNCN